jgi:repressor LexA
MADRPLSERQKAMLAYIETFIGDNGYPPTIREIGEACDIPSTSVVNYNLNRLEREGYIVREGKVSRGIRLVRTVDGGGLDQSVVLRVPLVGRIVAGEPVPVPGSDFSYFGADEAIELTRDIVKEDTELYALEVEGDSMIDAMISDGDIVIMKSQPTANNGEMVAVWLTDKEETTLKRFYREKGKVRLQPENATMKPIIINDPETVQIQGRVVAVVRQVN